LSFQPSSTGIDPKGGIGENVLLRISTRIYGIKGLNTTTKPISTRIYGIKGLNTTTKRTI
jgi:hypothetical protein